MVIDVKCHLRQPGFNAVLASSTIITHIAYSLHNPSYKLRALVSDILAAICILAITEGYNMVMAAMSDYRIVFEESFLFEEVISSLRLPTDTNIHFTVRDNQPTVDNVDTLS